MSINLMEVIKEPGVSDLQLHVKGPFAQALIAERMGDHQKAAEKLDVAVAREDTLASE